MPFNFATIICLVFVFLEIFLVLLFAKDFVTAVSVYVSVYCVFVFVVYAAASAVFVKDAVKDPVRASAAVNVIAISFFISVLQSLI